MMQPGAAVGRYLIRDVLGWGGFATVYRAWDPVMAQDVALKLLLPQRALNPLARRRFLAEMRALAPLRHPNIVAFYGAGEADGQLYYAMEVVEGATLATLAQNRPLPLTEVAALLGPLCSAIDYLHAAGVVHRDLKAGNVMLTTNGRVVLMDFGIARALDETQLTLTAGYLGTPGVMSPEQVRGQPVGPRADIYALGALTFQLLAGRLPFTGDAAHVLHAHAFDDPPPLRDFAPGLPEDVYAIVAAALAKDPAERPARAAAFAAPFVRFGYPPPAEQTSDLPPVPDDRRGATSTAGEASPRGVRQAPGWPRRHWRWLAAGALTSCLLALALLLALRLRSTPSHAGETVSDFAIYDLGTWAQAQGGLQACFNLWSVPAGGGTRLRITPLSGDGAPLEGPLTAPGKLGENQCLTLRAAAPVAAGDYQATLLDGSGAPLAQTSFSALVEFGVRGIDRWSAASGDLEGCFQGAAGLAPGGLLLRVQRDSGGGPTASGPLTVPQGDGEVCIAAPPLRAPSAGVYRASVFDSQGRELARATFDVLTAVAVQGVAEWAAGAGPLRVCFHSGGALSGRSLTLRVVRDDGQAQPIEGATASAGPSGASCLSAPPATPPAGGAYQAQIVDGLGRPLAGVPFSTPAGPELPQPSPPPSTTSGLPL